MPFVALSRPKDDDGADWERVSAFSLDRDTLHGMRSTHEFRCPDPDCAGTLYFRAPVAARHHFYHKAADGLDTCLLRQGETQAHMMAKDVVAEWALNQARFRGGVVELELILQEDGIKRIADVAVMMPDGELTVLECQLAYQSVDDFRTRTQDYYALGADNVLWFVENELIHGPLQEWARGQDMVGVLHTRRETRKVL